MSSLIAARQQILGLLAGGSTRSRGTSEPSCSTATLVAKSRLSLLSQSRPSSTRKGLALISQREAHLETLQADVQKESGSAGQGFPLSVRRSAGPVPLPRVSTMRNGTLSPIESAAIRAKRASTSFSADSRFRAASFKSLRARGLNIRRKSVTTATITTTGRGLDRDESSSGAAEDTGSPGTDTDRRGLIIAVS